MTDEREEVQIGDRVLYHPAVVGGYGYKGDIPAVVIGFTAKRVAIRIRIYEDDSVRTIFVAPQNVRPMFPCVNGGTEP